MRSLIIYLDTSQWHALADAGKGTPRNPRDPEVLVQLRELARRQEILLPLSCFNYFELAEYSNDEGRERAGGLMGELSGFRTIAPLHFIMQEEVEASLKARFGKPAEPQTFPKFGFGAGFAMGKPLALRLEGATPEQAELIEAQTGLSVAQLLARLQVQAEFAMLIGPRRAEWDNVPGYNPFGGRELVDQELQSIMVMVNNLLGETELAKRPSDGIVARQLGFDLRPVFAPAMVKAGFGIGDWPFADKEDLTDFLLSMPSRRIAVLMQRHYVHKGKHLWEISDLRDIDALSLTLPLCDVVVTDKEVFDAATGEELDTTFGKKILRRLVDLGDYLNDLHQVGAATAQTGGVPTAG